MQTLLEPVTLEYDLGPARDLAHGRPSVADLQRAAARAAARGDRRRAVLYERVVLHRVEAAQVAARVGSG